MTAADRPLYRDWRAAAIAVLFAGQALLALGLDPRVRPDRPALSARPEGPRIASTVRAAAELTGMRVVVGHAFWFRVIQYYGDSGNSRERYAKLFPYCNLTADLNPYYVPLYAFGAAPLAFHLKRPDEAVQLLHRGIEANPGATRLKLMLAAVGFQNRSEWDKVIPLLEAQIMAGDAPTMLVNILANTYKSAGRHQDAIRLWRHIQRRATSDEQRILAGVKLQELYRLTRGASEAQP